MLCFNPRISIWQCILCLSQPFHLLHRCNKAKFYVNEKQINRHIIILILIIDIIDSRIQFSLSFFLFPAKASNKLVPCQVSIYIHYGINRVTSSGRSTLTHSLSSTPFSSLTTLLSLNYIRIHKHHCPVRKSGDKSAFKGDMYDVSVMI